MACIAKRRERYVIDFYDNTGKRRWKTLPKGVTKAKAKEALRDIEDSLAKNMYLPDKKIPTFKEVAADWLVYKKPNLRASTWSVYEGHKKNHFSELNELKINHITVARLEKYVAARLEEKINLGTLKKILISLGQILSYAVRHKYIDHNPIRDIERPRGNGKETKFKIKVLTPPEINDFLGKVNHPKFKMLFMLALMSGARQGELLGMKWSDVDWVGSQIHIQRTFNNSAWYATKTKASNRKIDIGPSVMKALKQWKLACLPNKTDLVFPNDAGNPLDDSGMLRRHFHPAINAAGIDRIRFHDMRHTFASLLIEQGENIKYVQTQLGHSSPSVTLDVYAHLMKPTNPRAACRLEKTVFEQDGSKMVASGE